MYVFLLLSALWILLLAAEELLNRKYLSSFRAVIHVNGIRGKTSTCRALDAALRTKYRVFTKTTGTDAAVIDVSGTGHPVRRLGPANIHEQLRTIRRAHREGAEILILECMAVNPELQRIAQERIVKSGISVITNVRYDHVFEMGDTKEEISRALSAVIPEKGLLFTADPRGEKYWGELCRQKGTELILCAPSLREAGTAAENECIAREISRRLGVSEEEFLQSRGQIKEDFGVRRLYDVSSPGAPGCMFLNLFSANDPESTVSNLESFRRELCAGGRREQPPLAFLYNHRTDRPDRALLFARHFIPRYPKVPVFICGSGAPLPRRLFRAAGAENVRILRNRAAEELQLPGLLPGTLIAGIGNIKGPAYRLVTRLELEKQTSDTCRSSERSSIHE